jgi:hypothetical protein
MNKGDNATHVNGALPTGNDNVMLVSVSEGFRDNSAGGGAASYGVATPGLTGNPSQWEVHTHSTNIPAEEHNVNFAAAFFGRESGFQMDAAVPADATGHLDLNLSGVNSETDGVLIANSHGNSARFAAVNPKAGGAGWDIDVQNVDLTQPFDNATPPAPNGLVTYVFLPYETENLVAGRIAADGSVINSTGVGTGAGQFTLTKSGTGQYTLTVSGRTPDDGTLLLAPAEGMDGIADNVLAYEPSGSNFLITGLDLITQAEKDLGQGVTFEDTAFSFAFIDYDAPLVAPGGGNFLEADFNQDGDVDGGDLNAWKAGFGDGTTKAEGDADADADVDGRDLLTWQRQLGQSPPATIAAGAVPEPSAAMLALLAVAGSLAAGRWRS